MPRVETITELAGLTPLEKPWRELLARGPQASIFQTPEWLLTWWRHYGGRRRLWALAWREGEALLGLLPLMGHPLGPARRIGFVGTLSTDYLDAIVEPGREKEFWQAALPALLDLPWDVLDLQQVPEPSPTWRVLPEVASGLPLTVQVCDQEPCPYLPLPGDWETFRQSLGKKIRWNLGYYPRLAAREQGGRVYRVPAEEVPGAMSRLFDLHGRRWRRRWLPGAFASGRTRRFHHEVAVEMDRAGQLRLYALELGGEVRALLYCYADGDRMYYYQGGFDPAIARYSPGTILVGHAAREAIEAGLAGFDFLRGGEGYKYRWGATDRMNHRLRLARRTWRGRLGLALSRREQEVEELAKKIANRVAAPG